MVRISVQNPVRVASLGMLVALLPGPFARASQLASQERSTIRGVVTDASTGRALAGVAVSLEMSISGRADVQRQLREDPTWPRYPGGPFQGYPDINSIAGTHEATTDELGRYQFTDVFPGEYHLWAAADGFIVGYVGESGSSSAEPTTRIPAGSALELDFPLAPGGAIRGRVLDPAGEPLAGMGVVAQTYQYVSGRRALTDFVAIAEPDLPGRDDPVISSRAVTNEFGEYRLFGLRPDDYYVRVTSEADESVSPLYYSGTTDPSSAVAVRVTAGADMIGIDVPWRPVPRVPVTGHVEGLPTDQTAYVVLVRREDDSAAATVLADPEGKFTLMAVPNRNYELIAVTGSIPSSTAFSDRHFGTVPIYPGESGVQDVTITVTPPLELQGQLSWASVPPVEFQDFDDLWVGIHYDSVIGDGGIALDVAPDGYFDFRSSPIPYTITMAGLPPGTYLESGRYGSTDPLAGRFDPTIDPSATLELRIGSQPAEITGRVTDGDAAYPGAVVTLVPDDDRRERLDLYRETVSQEDGRFRFDTVPPGIYRIWAWTSIPEGAIESDEFRLPFESQGIRVFAERLGTSNVEVKLIRLPGSPPFP